MDTNISFYPRPRGVSSQRPLPEAESASTDTTVQLVGEHEADAFYFRALERGGILLNKPQLEAVRYGQGPLLTLAGAGCGKTTVLAARTGYLLAVRGVSPSSILLVTFTSKAAAEMKERIAALPGIRPAAARAVQARTFHSFALALLRHQGVTEDIFGDTQAQHTVMKMVLRQLGLSEAYQPETLLSALSAWKVDGRWTHELPETSQEEREVKQALLAYEAWKQERQKIDFDDILLHASKLLRKPAVLLPLQKRFSFVMVDEFQDTNALQYEMVRMLTAQHRNLMVVGDDDQTIYTFNGARQESILQFDKVYQEAHVITLNINYRSDARIVGLGSSIVAKNRKRRAKRLVSAGKEGLPPQFFTPANPEEEATHVVSHLLQQVQAGTLRYSDIAILHRTGSGSRSIFEQLVLRDVPFIQYGASAVFYDQSLIRPLLDHLRLALDPRRMECIPGALGPLYVPRESSLEHIRQEEKKQAKKYPLIHLAHWERLRDFQQEQVKERIRLIKRMAAMKPLAAIQEMRKTFYDKYLESGDPGTWTHYKETLQENMEELETAARRFDTVEAFVSFADELSKRHREMESLRNAADSDAVSLMTIHRAKGLEFPCVYLIGASEGILPHSTALGSESPEDLLTSVTPGTLLEEERRLAYVAVTRAKQRLYITSPAANHGKPAALSRFLLEAYGLQPPVPAGDVQRPHASAKAGSRTRDNKARMITIPVWICSSPACSAWIRKGVRQTGSARTESLPTADSPPVCPLCSSPMQEGTRSVPAR